MENKSETQTIIMNVEPGAGVITPYGMARTANDMFRMADAYPVNDIVSLAKYYVFCASIEIGMKAAILGVDCTSKNKELIKSLGHDLCKVHDTFRKNYDSPWGKDDLNAITAINPYFSKKGLEYCTTDVVVALLKGFSEVPDIQLIREAAYKVNAFLHSNELFLNATTSEVPSRGLITFY